MPIGSEKAAICHSTHSLPERCARHPRMVQPRLTAETNCRALVQAAADAETAQTQMQPRGKEKRKRGISDAAAFADGGSDDEDDAIQLKKPSKAAPATHTQLPATAPPHAPVPSAAAATAPPATAAAAGATPPTAHVAGQSGGPSSVRQPDAASGADQGASSGVGGALLGVAPADAQAPPRPPSVRPPVASGPVAQSQASPGRPMARPPPARGPRPGS